MRKEERIELNKEDIEKELMSMSRGPFRSVLANLLECEPSPEAIRTFAEKHVDRWAQCLAIAGRLSGYHERLQLDSNIHSIHTMSDMELHARLAQVTNELAGLNAGQPLGIEQNTVDLEQPSEKEPDI